MTDDKTQEVKEAAEEVKEAAEEVKEAAEAVVEGDAKEAKEEDAGFRTGPGGPDWVCFSGFVSAGGDGSGCRRAACMRWSSWRAR